MRPEDAKKQQGAKGQKEEISPATAASETVDKSHVVRVDHGHSNLKTTRRVTWTTYISKLDKDALTICSCWLLLLTFVGVFAVVVVALGRQICMLVFFMVLAVVTSYVLFLQPPDGVYRRQLVVRLLTGQTEPTDQVFREEPKLSNEPLSKGEVSKSPQLRKPSMMYEKYDETSRVPIPTVPGNPASPKRGALHAFLRRMTKGHLQVNPYYTTLTEEGSLTVSPQEQNPKSESHDEELNLDEVESYLCKKKAYSRSGKKESLTPWRLNSPPQSPKMTAKSISDSEVLRRQDRTSSVYNYGTPAMSGLKPMKTGLRDVETPKLGGKRKPSPPAAKAVGFHNVSPAPKKKTVRSLSVDDWRKVVNSSFSISERSSSEASCYLINVPKFQSPIQDRRTSRNVPLIEDTQSGKTRIYLMRDANKGFRKVYHVWNK